MKVKILFIKFTVFFFIISVSLAEEIKFKADSMNLKNEGNLVIAYNSETILPKKKLTITSNKVEYDKKKDEVVFTGNVFFQDKNKNFIIQGNKIKYNKLKDYLYSYGDTKINLNNKYIINSKNINYDRSKEILYGNYKTIIKDEEKNIFNLKDTFIFNIKDEVLKSKNSKITDKNENEYIFEDLIIDLKRNQIAGNEIKINFNKSYFGNEKNDPILKGRSSYSTDEELKVYKAVFSTCNIKNKKCRGWELNTDEFNHDKTKKIFEYRKSWLKILNLKLFYLPYFNHPDPTVKRKSGFLTPSYSSSDSLGTSINVPYFKTLGKDKDVTFNPRFYADKSFLMQSQYRQALKNSNVMSDLSFLIGEAGTKGHLFYNQTGNIKDNVGFNLNLQNVRGDNYLKTHKLSDISSMINSDNLLISNIDLNWDFENANLYTSFKIFEDLSRNDNDRYQYIFPDFNFNRSIKIPESYNGVFNFNSYGYNKVFDTNVTESVLTNDFLFSSNEVINSNGLTTDFDILLKNSNNYSDNSTNYEENFDYNLYGIFKVDHSFPLVKSNKNYTNYLKPIVSFRYSPNGNSDLSNKDVLLNYNSVFDINRIGTTSQVEGGESVSLGLEFKHDDSSGKNILDFQVANVLKPNENYTLPSKSKLNEKRSDIFGNIKYNYNKYLNLGYSFSYDKDLKYSNQDQLSLDLNLNNFYTNISYYSEQHDLPDVENIKNTTKLNFNEENNLKFELSKDLNDNFTEYYNLVYTYVTDCISFDLSFNKSFYRDGSLEPSKSLSFLVKIIPFTEIGVQNIGNFIRN